MNLKSTKWYQRRLAKYFEEHYSQYEDETEFFCDPAPNQWTFYIPRLQEKIELTCGDNGTVMRIIYPPAT